MSGGTLYSFRIKDAEIDQTLAAMPGRSDFIRRAVIETLSASHNDDDHRRLRAGLISIADSSAAILDAGGDDVPEFVRFGLIGIGDAAAVLAAGGHCSKPEAVQPPSIKGMREVQ